MFPQPAWPLGADRTMDGALFNWWALWVVCNVLLVCNMQYSLRNICTSLSVWCCASLYYNEAVAWFKAFHSPDMDNMWSKFPIIHSLFKFCAIWYPLFLCLIFLQTHTLAGYTQQCITGSVHNPLNWTIPQCVLLMKLVGRWWCHVILVSIGWHAKCFLCRTINRYLWWCKEKGDMF